MSDAQFASQPQDTTPKPDFTPASKRRKVIGQCPTCQHSFASRHELRAHMADPSIHAPVSDSDAVSFGELSSEYDSSDEAAYSYDGKSTNPGREDEPRLDTDGFEFVAADDSPNLQQDGFEFLNADDTFHAKPAADHGSIHTLPDSDDQPSADFTPIDIPPARPRVPRGGALGVLYCGTCDKHFGNERVFKRHFMFGAKHGQEERDVRELYYKVWGQSWAEEAREERIQEVDEMEM